MVMTKVYSFPNASKYKSLHLWIDAAQCRYTGMIDE